MQVYKHSRYIFLPSCGGVPVPSTHTADNAIILLAVTFFCNRARTYECDAEGGALTAKTHVRNRGDSRDRDRQRRRGVQRSFSRDMPGLNPPRDTAPFFAGACLRIPPRLNPSALVFWAWTVRGMLRKPSRQSTPRGDGPRPSWTAGGVPLLSIAPAMPTSTWLDTAISRCATDSPIIPVSTSKWCGIRSGGTLEEAEGG